ELIPNKLVGRELPGHGVRLVLTTAHAESGRVVAMSLEDAPMKLIGPAARGHGDVGWTRVTSVRADGLDPELLDGVQSRLHSCYAAPESVHDRQAVKRDFQGPDFHAVDPGSPGRALDARSQGE